MTATVWIWILVTVYLVQTFGILSITLRGGSKPSTTLTWVAVCLCFPVVGLVLYIFVMRPVPKRTRVAWEHHPYQAPDSTLARALQHLLHDVASDPARVDIHLYTAGDAFYAHLMQDIQQAQSEILVEFYIVRNDPVGRLLFRALMERAQAGVRVRFLRDGLGSLGVPRKWVREMRQSGVITRIFFPLRFPYVRGTLNHRDHSKIVVIDNHLAYLGGMNVGLEYTGRDPKHGPWRDTHARLEGAAARDLAVLFEANWSVATPDGSEDARSVHGLEEARAGGRPEDPHMREGAAAYQTEDTVDSAMSAGMGMTDKALSATVQIVDSGPDSRRQAVRETFFLLCTQAQYAIDLTTPYFLPDSDMLAALRGAALRGVRVRLLIPERVDHRWVGYACQTYLPQLLDCGIEVYLWTPGVLHAKVLVVDEQVSVVGAANCDFRSFRLNYEVDMVGHGRELARTLTEQFAHDLEHSIRYDAERARPERAYRFIHRIGRLIAPLL